MVIFHPLNFSFSYHHNVAWHRGAPLEMWRNLDLTFGRCRGSRVQFSPLVSHFFSILNTKINCTLKTPLKDSLESLMFLLLHAKKYYSTIHFINIIFTFVVYIPYIIINSTWLTFCIHTYLIFFIACSFYHVTCSWSDHKYAFRRKRPPDFPHRKISFCSRYPSERKSYFAYPLLTLALTLIYALEVGRGGGWGGGFEAPKF